MAVSAPALGQTPPADGLVTVRRTGEDVANASVGFVADARGHVIAHLGAGIEEVDGEQFLVRIRNGGDEVDRPAAGVAYDGATGLALLSVDGELPTPYRFASVSAGSGRLVYGATSLPAGEGAGFGVHRGIVQGVESASQSDSPQPDWIRVSDSIAPDGEGAGSPLFDNCGDLLGVIVDYRELDAPVPTAAPGDWLNRAFGNAGWAPVRAERQCPPESARIDAIVQARVEAARAGSRERYVAWTMGGVSVMLAVMLVLSRRSNARMKRDKALAELDLEEARAAVVTRQAREAARVPDVLLTGSDDEGKKVALRIPRGSIVEPPGAVVGRVPVDGVFVLDRPEVSRRHLRFLEEDGVLKVEDLGSTNGTHLDGTALEAGGKVEVRDDARLGIGSLKLAVRLETGAKSPVHSDAGAGTRDDTGK